MRHGDNNWSDGGGPQRFSLVRPDGTVDRIGVTTEETVHSTDATQPYLAYAEETEAGVDVVVRDLRDDSEAAERRSRPVRPRRLDATAGEPRW